ncbi:MAG TPA: SDR family oxidoreductase [Saprospiraceae bacterium]|nr:SDR family oxidoreductase [Saprospiraceae bacterium]HMP23912.1 SDR family oxidoreductase [Saprospiraceae bacterium]
MEILANKKVLVVGATGGIGAETVRLLKNSQANVFISGRSQTKLAEVATANGIPDAQVFAIDITQPEQVEAAAQQVHAQAGALDILINVAGIGIIHPLETLGYEDFSRVIDVNLKGAFHIFKAFLPPMKEAKKGLIINLPGVLGKTPMAGAAAYAASKYGLEGMTKSIREELKRTDVRITNLYLGGTDTPFWDEINLRVNREKFVNAREAARAIWFLCQQPSSGVVSEMVLQPFNHQAI